MSHLYPQDTSIDILSCWRIDVTAQISLEPGPMNVNQCVSLCILYLRANGKTYNYFVNVMFAEFLGLHDCDSNNIILHASARMCAFSLCRITSTEQMTW